MKNILILALAAAALAATAPTATAGNYRYSSCEPQYTCRPVYRCTKELCRRTECRWAVDHCGRRYRYEVVVITYADIYSDGSRNTYTRTYRA